MVTRLGSTLGLAQASPKDGRTMFTGSELSWLRRLMDQYFESMDHDGFTEFIGSATRQVR